MRKILGSLVIFALIIGFSGCASKVANLNTAQLMQQFIKGKTTAQKVRAKYGDPTVISFMTLTEAREMFQAKDQNAENDDYAKAFDMIAQTIALEKSAQSSTSPKEKVSNPNNKVIYWAYDDFTVSDGSIFDDSKKTKKGAKLMLIFNTKFVLIDYEFRKYNNKKTW